METVIPDCRRLVDAVMAAATNADSFLHGPGHWRCVAWIGLRLLPAVPGADAAIVFLFGLLHDSMRLNDGHDPDHGRRAGLLARRLNGSAFQLDDDRLDRLQFACDHHTGGGRSADPTIAVCWDADRLNLWRVGTAPDPRFLSTEPAREKEMIRDAARLEAQHFEWEDIYRAYAESKR